MRTKFLFLNLLVAAAIVSCKAPRSGLSGTSASIVPADRALSPDEKEKTYVAGLMSMAILGQSAHNEAVSVDLALHVLENSKSPAMRAFAASELSVYMRHFGHSYLRSGGVSQLKNLSITLKQGKEYRKSDLIEIGFYGLRNQQSAQCRLGEGEAFEYQFQVCSHYGECLESMMSLDRLIKLQPNQETESVGRLFESLESDIACLPLGARKLTLNYLVESLKHRQKIYSSTTLTHALNGRIPRVITYLDSANFLEAKVAFGDLIQEHTVRNFSFLNPMEVNSSTLAGFYPDVASQYIFGDLGLKFGWGQGDDQGESKYKWAGEFLKYPTWTEFIASLNQWNENAQSFPVRVLQEIETLSADLIAVHQDNLILYHYLGRLTLPKEQEPQDWLDAQRARAVQWRAAVAGPSLQYSDYNLDEGPLHPFIFWNVLSRFGENELHLASRRDWLRTMESAYHLIPTSLLDKYTTLFVGGLELAKNRVATTDQRLETFLSQTSLGAQSLLGKELQVARQMQDRSFHSLFYQNMLYEEALELMLAAQLKYHFEAVGTFEARIDFRDDDQREMIDQRINFASHWIQFACMNHLVSDHRKISGADTVNTGANTISSPLGCWNLLAHRLDWRKQVYSGVAPQQCIAEDGSLHLNQVCAKDPRNPQINLAHIRSQIKKCQMASVVFDQCQIDTAGWAQTSAMAASIGATVLASVTLGPKAGAMTRVLTSALTFNLTNRAMLSYYGLRDFRDPRKTLYEDWGRDLAVTTLFMSTLGPMFRMTHSLRMSVAGRDAVMPFWASRRAMYGFASEYSANVGLLVGLDYATPYLLQPIYSELSPQDLGADKPFTERLMRSASLTALFMGISGGLRAINGAMNQPSSSALAQQTQVKGIAQAKESIKLLTYRAKLEKPLTPIEPSPKAPTPPTTTPSGTSPSVPADVAMQAQSSLRELTKTYVNPLSFVRNANSSTIKDPVVARELLQKSLNGLKENKALSPDIKTQYQKSIESLIRVTRDESAWEKFMSIHFEKSLRVNPWEEVNFHLAQLRKTTIGRNQPLRSNSEQARALTDQLNLLLKDSQSARSASSGARNQAESASLMEKADRLLASHNSLKEAINILQNPRNLQIYRLESGDPGLLFW